MSDINLVGKSVFYIWATGYCVDTIIFGEDKLMILLTNYPGGEVNRFTSNECTNLWGTNCFRSARAFCMTLILSFKMSDPIKGSKSPRRNDGNDSLLQNRRCRIGTDWDATPCLLIVNISPNPLSPVSVRKFCHWRGRVGKVRHLIVLLNLSNLDGLVRNEQEIACGRTWG